MPARPEPSTSRLFEAIYSMQAAPPGEATARVVRECQRRLALRELNEIAHAMQGDGAPPMAHAADVCPRHGPGCTHPACRALSSLLGRAVGAAAGGAAGGAASGAAGLQLPYLG